MKKCNKRHVIVFFIWAAVIIFLGSQPAASSNKLSKTITRGVVSIVEVFDPDVDISIRDLNNILRDIAHFGIYFVMGVLSIIILNIKGMRGIKAFMIALVLTLFLAVADEYHQIAIPGRGGELSDIVKDGLGSLTGISFCMIGKNLKMAISGTKTNSTINI